MACWSDEETLKLIEIWGEDTIQAMLEGSKRNKDVFNKISRRMEAAGYEKTADQCNSKIRKLKLEYRKIKDTRKKTGTGRKDWKYFEEMDAILGHKPATQPPVVVESGEGAAASSDSPRPSHKSGEEDDEITPECLGDPKTDESESSRSCSETPVVEVKKGKKRKSSDKGEKMESVLEKVMKMQSESEQHYLRLEEKMIEMEEQRQKESREFQLQMMALLTNQRGQAQESHCSRPAPGPSFNYHQMYSFPDDTI